MNLVSLIFFCLTLSFAQAVPDCNNPLTSTFSFTEVPLRYKTAEESSHCANLNNKPTCCSKNVFAYGMVGYTSKLAYFIESDFITQDAFIQPMIEQIIDPSTYDLDTFNTEAGNLKDALFPSVGTPIVTGDTATKISNFISLVQGWYDTVYGKTPDDINDLFTDMATERTKCYSYVGKVLANLECLACDANYASTQGVSVYTGSDGVSELIVSYEPVELASSCYNYIDKAAKIGYAVDVASLSSSASSQTIHSVLNPTTPYTNNDDVEAAMSNLAGQPFLNYGNGVPRKPNGCIDATNCPSLSLIFNTDGTLNRGFLKVGGIADFQWIRIPTPIAGDYTIPTPPFWQPDIENAGFDLDTYPTAMVYMGFGEVFQRGMVLTIMLLMISFYIL